MSSTMNGDSLLRFCRDFADALAACGAPAPLVDRLRGCHKEDLLPLALLDARTALLTHRAMHDEPWCPKRANAWGHAAAMAVCEAWLDPMNHPPTQ